MKTLLLEAHALRQDISVCKSNLDAAQKQVHFIETCTVSLGFRSTWITFSTHLSLASRPLRLSAVQAFNREECLSDTTMQFARSRKHITFNLKMNFCLISTCVLLISSYYFHIIVILTKFAVDVALGSCRSSCWLLRTRTYVCY